MSDGDPYALAKQLVEFQQYNVPEFYKWANRRGWQELVRDYKSAPEGFDKKCYYNAYTAVLKDSTLKLYIGYAMKASLGVPLAHAWVVDDTGVIHDCTPSWSDSEKVYYYGVELPISLAKMVFDYEDEHGETPSFQNDFFADIEWALTEKQKKIMQNLATTDAMFLHI